MESLVFDRMPIPPETILFRLLYHQTRRPSLALGAATMRTLDVEGVVPVAEKGDRVKTPGNLHDSRAQAEPAKRIRRPTSRGGWAASGTSRPCSCCRTHPRRERAR